MEHSEWDRILPIDSFANALHNYYAIYGLILLIYGTSTVLFNQRLFINEAILAITIGIMIGPQILNLFSPNDYFGAELDHSLLEISRFIVAINCVNVGIKLPKKYFWNKKIDMLMILGPIMGCMFLVAAVGVRVILGYSWINSLILGAILTPTDPVLIGTITNGKFADKYIPKRVRDLLAAESAANDALGFCFLYLPFYIDRHTSIGNQIGLYLLKIALYQIILGSLIGFLIGYATSRILQFSKRQGWIERKEVLCILIALNVIVY
jgi:sodium/hydrogen antiporter